MNVANEYLKLRTVISDQDISGCQALRFLLSSEPLIEIVAECGDLSSTQEALHCFRPHLLFLNAHMPDGNGVEAIAGLRSKETPIVVFTGRRDHPGINTLEASALDYLIKPFDTGRLRTVIERARLEFLRVSRRNSAIQSWGHLKANSGGTGQRRLVIKAGGRIIFLEVDEIEYIEAALNYVSIHAGKTSYRLREAIGNLASRLDQNKFGRIHRSFIVNVRQLKELEPCGSGQYMAILKSGKELPCSRKYRSTIQGFWEQSL